MDNICLMKKWLAIGIIVFFFSHMTQVVGIHTIDEEHLEVNEECASDQNIILPPPNTINDILEVTIHRRMSVREFTQETISDEDQYQQGQAFISKNAGGSWMPHKKYADDFCFVTYGSN